MGHQNPYSNAKLELFKSFEAEHLLNTNNKITNANLAIVDQKLESQDLYCEFLMYRDFFKSKSVHAEIADVVDLLSKEDGVYSQNMRLDFIYNRHTDFFWKARN